jgi:hypothetical protein
MRSRYRVPAGVIVYTMPPANCRGRTLAMPERFAGLNQSERLRYINARVRTIARVIVEPRYRSMGLAAWMVAETMERMNVPVIESLAVMGRCSSFFTRAGMSKIHVPQSQHHIELRRRLIRAGIPPRLWVNPEAVQERLDVLDSDHVRGIRRLMKRLLTANMRKRNLPDGPERTAFVLSRLCSVSAYFYRCAE